MFNSGIVYFDATGVDISLGDQTIEGIWAKFKQAYDTGKLVVMINATNHDSKMSPIPAVLAVGITETMGSFVIMDQRFTITSDDNITLITT